MTIGTNLTNRYPMGYLALLAIVVVALGYIFMNTSYFDRAPLTPVPPDAPYLDAALPNKDRVANLLSFMTLEEKIGQMTLVEKNSLKTVGDISDYGLGALLSGSGAKPADNTLAGWKQMIAEYQLIAASSRLRIPLLYGSDAIHGHAHVTGATVFPHAIGFGAAGNAALVRQVAAATAAEMTATGVNWNFAPTLDAPQDIRWGRVYETFSDDPTLVAELGAAYVEGLQSASGENNQRLQVLATPKHFAGLGAMGWDTSHNENFRIDQGVTMANDTLLQTDYLPPFQAAIEAGALSVMVGLNTWGDERTARQKYLLTDVLKGQLGFKGFLVSDWYGVHEGRRNDFWSTVTAINAGVDMVMLPFDYVAFQRHMLWANRLGLISDKRIDDAVSRILYAKFSLGLFDGEPAVVAMTDNVQEQHRALARAAVAQSLVLLKNENNVLPLNSSIKRINVAGSAANNVGVQMGAWSMEWQGVDGNWTPNSTSILAGITQVAGAQTIIAYNEAGQFAADTPRAQIGIAVVGESPYAEGWGDNPSPTLSAEDLATIKNLQQTSDSVIVILVTGRPLIITKEMADWDALVVAWLPGSEGAGVADVLFGAKEFTGTLPLPWPANIEQLPITATGVTTDDSEVLFPRYFGLNY